MKTQKAMATAPLASGSMAMRNNILFEFYNKPGYLSSQIDYLLAGFLFLQEGNSLSSPGLAVALDFIDRLLKFKIEHRQVKGANYGH